MEEGRRRIRHASLSKVEVFNSEPSDLERIMTHEISD